MNSARLTVWLILLSLVFVPVERLFALRSNRVPAATAIKDIGLYFFNSLVPVALLAVLFGTLAAATRALLPATWLHAMGALPWSVKVILSFLIGELGFYWGHRLSHQIPWLWRFHSVHHAPTHLYFLVNTHAHPIDIIFTRLCGTVPLYMLGLAGTTAATNTVPALLVIFGTAWGFFIHSNTGVRLGPLEWLIATPGFHHWHHTSRAPLDRNFASTLPFIDRVFGTHYLPAAWPAAYGLAAGGAGAGTEAAQASHGACEAPDSEKYLLK